MPYDPKFYTKRGRLNRYALACGYIERAESDSNHMEFRSVQLCMDGSVIYVRCYRRFDADSQPRREQFSTNKIGDARLVFSQKLKEYQLTFHPASSVSGGAR